MKIRWELLNVNLTTYHILSLYTWACCGVEMEIGKREYGDDAEGLLDVMRDRANKITLLHFIRIEKLSFKIKN